MIIRKHSLLLRKPLTPELKLILESMGYVFNSPLDQEYIATSNINMVTTITKDMWDNTNPHSSWNVAGRVDIGTNVDKFIELAGQIEMEVEVLE